MDFLVSYTAEDRDWAEWIASHLGALGYAYGLEDPPSGPGADPLAVAEHAVGRGQHVIVIVSSAFVEALRASGAPQAHRLVGSGRPVAVQIEPLELPTDLRQVPIAPMHEAADDYSTSRDLLLTAVRTVLPQPSVGVVDRQPAGAAAGADRPGRGLSGGRAGAQPALVPAAGRRWTGGGRGRRRASSRPRRPAALDGADAGLTAATARPDSSAPNARRPARRPGPMRRPGAAEPAEAA